MLSTLVLVVLVASAVLLHTALMDCHGHDVRVIVIGEKGKGSAEFYSVRGVRDEPSCIMGQEICTLTCKDNVSPS